MITAAVIVVMAVVMVVVVGAADLAARSQIGRWPWRRLERRRVLVNIEPDRTIAGILLRYDGPLLVLTDCTTTVGRDHQTVSIDGDVVIERRRVMWMQVLP